MEPSLPVKKKMLSPPPQDLVIAGLCGCRFARNNFKIVNTGKFLTFSLHKILPLSLLGPFKVFRYSFSEAIPIFFNRFKSDFILV